MKNNFAVLMCLVVVTLSSALGYADNQPGKVNPQGAWSWQVIKEKVTKKIYGWWEQIHPTTQSSQVAQNPAPPRAPVPAPFIASNVAVPPIKAVKPKAASAKIAVGSQTSKTTVVENRLPVQAKGLTLAGDPEPKVEVPAQVAAAPATSVGKIKFWFRSRWEGWTASPVTVKDNGLVVPAPEVTQIQSAQALPAGSNSAMSSMSRLKAWFKTSWLSQKLSLPSDSAGRSIASESVPEEAKIQNSAPQVNAIAAARIASPAIPSRDKNLTVSKNDIPVYRFERLRNKLGKVQVKKVPLLDVGQEAILDANTFKLVEIHPYPKASENKIESLAAPEVASNSSFRRNILGDTVVAAKPVEVINISILEAAKKVTGDKIAKLVYVLTPDVPYSEMPVVKYAEEDLKLLRGLILFEKKDQCHVASGIFSDLVNVAKADVAESAKFHLGVCLHEMNLPTEASHYLTKTIQSKNPDYAHDSIRAAVEDVQAQYEMPVIEAILGADQNNIPKESLAQVNYLKAKYFLRKGKPQKGLEAALAVPEKAPQYYRSQYVASVAEYELGKSDSSLDREKKIASEILRTGRDKDILALVEINLGREAFQKGKFKDSLDAFQKVPKENNLWMQSLMEQAWAQLQSKDMAGAIGNMHSIQSPYFNGVFKPESYVVRSIAYLNICQYPDAYKSIAFLEHTYQPWLEKLVKYNGEHSATQAYDTVLKQLQGKSNVDMDELPFQVIREAARQRDFLNAQEAVNQLIDEGTGYSFVKGLIEKDRKSLLLRRNANVAKITVLKEKIRKAASTPDAMKNFNAWRFELANLEDFVSVYDFKVQTLKEGAEGLDRLAPKALGRVSENKAKQKETAGKTVKEHLIKIAKELRQSLENDELLKYEVYAGSGENLRYKMAGGKTGGSANMSDRKPAGMHWEFDGEYWEDEIGNYRSSLKNNCQNMAAGQKRSE